MEIAAAAGKAHGSRTPVLTIQYSPWYSPAWKGGHDECSTDGEAAEMEYYRGELTWAKRARGNVGWRFAICYGAFAVLLVAAHAGQKAGLVEPPVEEATHQQALEESVAEFEESLSKDSRVSVKKDDGEA